MSNEHDPALLSDDLRVRLSQVFALGFLDAMAGFEITDDDVLVGIDAGAMEQAALACISSAEGMIHANYIENPQMVHDEVYAAGRLVYGEIERRAIQRN